MSTNLSGAYNTPKHVFYIGDNVNENIRNTYQDSLVFDRERRSVYAQNHEFGYICNYEKSISVRNADGTNSTVITLSVLNGEIRFVEYRSILITSCIPQYSYTNASVNTANNNVFVLGSTVNLDSINITISGSEESDILEIKNVHNNRNEFILTDNDANFIEGYPQIRKFIPVNSYGDLIKFTSNVAGKHNIVNVLIRDPKGAFDQKTLSITWENNVIMYKWKKDNLDFYGLKNFILNSSFNSIDTIIDNLSSSSVVYNNLTNNYRIGGTTITCTNGPDEYLVLFCPVRLQNNETFTGVLGGAAVQEFKKIKSIYYLNSAHYQELYNIYLATGHNWNGSSLKLN